MQVSHNSSGILVAVTAEECEQLKWTPGPLGTGMRLTASINNSDTKKWLTITPDPKGRLTLGARTAGGGRISLRSMERDIPLFGTERVQHTIIRGDGRGPSSIAIQKPKMRRGHVTRSRQAKGNGATQAFNYKDAVKQLNKLYREKGDAMEIVVDKEKHAVTVRLLEEWS